MTQPPARPAPAATPAHTPAPVAGASPAGDLVASLNKAARAFTLYDAKNAVVRQFLADYRARAEAATSGGELSLELAPWEIRCEGRVVYQEKDRERSLSFKLFRDGLRRITFLPGTPWEELLAFLRIVALRVTGVRQAEDDAVTLLRKAEFRRITFVAVEGYTTDDAAASGIVLHAGAAGLPTAFDLPLPNLPPPVAIAWREVPDAALASLRADDAPDALAATGLASAAELLGLAYRGLLPVAEAGRFCAEVRELLVGGRQLEKLGQLAALVRRIPPGPLQDEAVRALADARLLQTVLEALPTGHSQLPASIEPLLAFVPGEAVLEELAREGDEARRAALVAVATRRLPADADAIVAKLVAVPAGTARTLVRALAARAPEKLEGAMAALLGHPELALVSEALRAVSAAKNRVAPGPIAKLLQAPDPGVRTAAARALEHHGDAASARALAEVLSTRKDLEEEEAEALGRALGRLNPSAALRLFAEWLEPKKGLLSRFTGGGAAVEPRQRAAVVGLAVVAGAEAEALLAGLARSAEGELRLLALAAQKRRAGEVRRG